MKGLIRVFIFVLVVALFSPYAVAKQKQELSILAFDALTQENKPVDLRCKVERRNLLRSDVHQANVTVSVDGTLIAKVTTDGKGIASASYTPKKIGTYTVLFECPEGEDYSKASASALLFCRTKTKPAIVIDIDHTIADITLEKFLITKTKDIKPLPEASTVLAELAKTHDLIFLTARDEHLLHRTKEWLALHHFPDAPVFFRDMGKDPLSERKFKTDKIAQIKATWDNIDYGIGDKLSDAQAYLANGLKAIILSSKDAFPQQAQIVQRWQQIKALLMDMPRGQRQSQESR